MKLAWSLLPCFPASLPPCSARKHKRAILADGLNSGNEVGSAFQWSFRARQLSGGRGICFSEKFKNTADPSSPLASGNDGLACGNEVDSRGEEVDLRVVGHSNNGSGLADSAQFHICIWR